MYALIDCNSFYCSCERVFRPDLADKPVIVLSNNDGCAIAMSTEAKILGVTMGTPYFELKKLIKQAGITVFSSNYELYGDFSRRVMSVLGSFSPIQEIYSIDECFLDLTGFRDLDAYARQIRAMVKQWTGIPVSIGIGPTKTLAKIASKYAKKYPEITGGVSVLDQVNQTRVIAQVSVRDVWGVGYRWAKRLNAQGINTAEDLRQADPIWISRTFNVVLARTVRELNGIACISLETTPKPKQQIVVSRSFGHMTEDIDNLKESITAHATRAGEKLRKEGHAVSVIHVFAHTNAFISDDPQYHGTTTIRLPYPTQDTRILVQNALAGLNRIYKRGYRYKKAGIMLLELHSLDLIQVDLFTTKTHDNDCTLRLMDVLDRINRKMGRGTLYIASQGMKRHREKWHLRRKFQSPRYTTNWSDLRRIS